MDCIVRDGNTACRPTNLCSSFEFNDSVILHGIAIIIKRSPERVSNNEHINGTQ